MDQITREVLKEQLQQEIAQEYAEEGGDEGGVDDLMMELSFHDRAKGSRPEDKEVTNAVSRHFPKPPTVPVCITYTLLYTWVGGGGHTDCHGA